MLIFQWFYKHFWLAPFGLFALVLALKSVFAAQAPCGSDFGISRRYVILMFGEQCHFKIIKKTTGFISKIDKRMLQQCSPKGMCFPCLMTQPQGSPK